MIDKYFFLYNISEKRMSDNKEEEIVIKPEEVNSELDKIDEDLAKSEKIGVSLINDLKPQLEINNKLLEDDNPYPALRRYKNGFFIIIVLSVLIFYEISQNYDRDLY